MKHIIRWFFRKYPKEFEDVFISDLFGDIPKEVMDDSLRVLNTGRKELDRFFRWNAFVLQRKIQQPLRHAESYIGGLVFIKTLATILDRASSPKEKTDMEPIEEPKRLDDALAGVDSFFGKNSDNIRT